MQLVINFASWTFRDSVRDSVFLAMLRLCEWYVVVRSKSTTEAQVREMEIRAVVLRRAIRDAVTRNGKEYNSKAVKHHTILHYPQLVREYGALLYQSCEMWDSAHKYIIKAHLSSHGRGNFQQLVERRVGSLIVKSQGIGIIIVYLFVSRV